MVCPSLVVVAAFCAPVGGRPDPAAVALLRNVQAKHRATIAAIRTLSCRLRLELVNEPVPGSALPDYLDQTYRYWRVGTDFRIRTYLPPRDGSEIILEDEIFRGGHTLGASYSESNPTRVSRYVHSFGGNGSWGDVWNHCLFMHWGAKVVSFRTFDGLLAEPHKLARVERVTEDGRSMVYVELTHAGGRLGFWFDPEWGHLARKTTTVTAGDPDSRHEYEVGAVVRGAGGAILPVRIEHRTYKKGQLLNTLRSVVEDVRLNEPLPADVFRIEWIAGATCFDSVRGSKYVVDADGRRTGPETFGRRALDGGYLIFDPPAGSVERSENLPPPPPAPPAVGPTRDDLYVFGAVMAVGLGGWWAVSRWAGRRATVTAG